MGSEFNLPYGKFILEIKVVHGNLYMPEFKGTLLRGAFGNIFREACCITGIQSCNGCLLVKNCPFAYVFETLSETVEGNSVHAYGPHPYVLEPPEGDNREFPEEAVFQVGLVLLGKGVSYLPYFIMAFERMGSKGLGPGKVRCVLENVYQSGRQGQELIYSCGQLRGKVLEGTLSIPAHMQEILGKNAGKAENATEKPFGKGEHNARLELEILTPLRLQEGGLFLETINFTSFIKAIFRRLDLLGKAHGPGGLDLNFSAWLNLADTIKTFRQDLRWLDWERISFRQNRSMKMGGVTGRVVFKGNIHPFMPFIEAAEIVHVGKNTAFGLGRISIQGCETVE